MGHCDSPAEFRSHSGFLGPEAGSAATDPGRGNQRRIEAKRLEAGARSAGKWLALAVIRFYQIFLGPFLGGACKFHPSCSNYAYEAVMRHGARRGTLLALKRLGRCRPFTQGGFDPVPEAGEHGASANTVSHASMRSKELRQ